MPDLPKANYDVWVRGYGLVDSPKVKATPGKTVNLKAVAAPDAKAAAASTTPRSTGSRCCRCRRRATSPAPGPQGNGISPNIKSQGEWIRNVVNTDGCTGCHQMGGKATREIPASILGTFEDIEGGVGSAHSGRPGRRRHERALHAGRPRARAGDVRGLDRSHRRTASCRPRRPPRPQGSERNVVVTMWDWADPKVYLHDEIASDKRNPTVNANGPIYGALEESGDYLPVVDPTTQHGEPGEADGARSEDAELGRSRRRRQPSPYWGDEAIWNSQTTRAQLRDGQAGPRLGRGAHPQDRRRRPWCQAGSDHPSAKLFPINQSQRGSWSCTTRRRSRPRPIDTCFSWGHVNFDDNDVLWSSFGPAGVEGWFDTKIWDKTHDEKKAQGWTRVRPRQQRQRQARRVHRAESAGRSDEGQAASTCTFYGVLAGARRLGLGNGAGHAGRRSCASCPDAHPPETALAEYYEVPWNNPKASGAGLRAARHGRRQQRRRLDGALERTSRELRSPQVQGPAERPDGDGTALPRRLDALSAARAELQGRGRFSAAPTRRYYDFVDRFDMLGVGKDVPLATGNESEGLLALVDGKFLTLRVPYPMGFFAKGMDGRIDNPNAGWKGKAIYTTLATRAPFHVEGGKGTTSKLVKFQVRPTPLVEVEVRPRLGAGADRASRTSSLQPLVLQPLLLRDRPDVVHDLPDVLVLQLIPKRAHVEVGRDAVLDRVEDLAVGRSVLPFLVGEVGRRRRQIVARAAFGVQAVAVRAVSR